MFLFLIFALIAFIWFVPEGRRLAIDFLKFLIKVLDSKVLDSKGNTIPTRNARGKQELVKSLADAIQKLPFSFSWVATAAIIGFIFGIISLSGLDLYSFKFFFWIIPAGTILAGFISGIVYQLAAKKFHFVPSGNIFLSVLLGTIFITYIVNFIPYNVDGYSDYYSLWEYIDPSRTELWIKGKTVTAPAFFGYLIFIIEITTFTVIGWISISLVRDLPYDEKNKQYLQDVLTIKRFFTDNHEESSMLESLGSLMKNKKYLDCINKIISINSCQERDSNSMIEIEVSKSPSSDLHHIYFNISKAVENEDDNEKVKWEKLSDKSDSAYFNTSEDISLISK